LFDVEIPNLNDQECLTLVSAMFTRYPLCRYVAFLIPLQHINLLEKQLAASNLYLWFANKPLASYSYCNPIFKISYIKAIFIY